MSSQKDIDLQILIMLYPFHYHETTKTLKLDTNSFLLAPKAQNKYYLLLLFLYVIASIYIFYTAFIINIFNINAGNNNASINGNKRIIHF